MFWLLFVNLKFELKNKNVKFWLLIWIFDWSVNLRKYDSPNAWSGCLSSPSSLHLLLVEYKESQKMRMRNLKQTKRMNITFRLFLKLEKIFFLLQFGFVLDISKNAQLNVFEECKNRYRASWRDCSNSRRAQHPISPDGSRAPCNTFFVNS